MLPDLRFAIGAVLASALLIVTAFGLAATVRVAHHRAARPDDPWRVLAFADPADWGLLAAQPRPTTAARTETPDGLPGRLAVTAPDPDTTGAIDKSERQPAAEGNTVEIGGQLAALDTQPATALSEPAAGPAESPPQPVDVVAAIPEPALAPVQPSAAPPDVDIPNVAIPNAEAEVLESSERVGALPGFPTAGHGFVPPRHPIALPVPDPRDKPGVKKIVKKKAAARRQRAPAAASPPFGNTGYPVTGFPVTTFPAIGSDKNPVIGSDKKWIVD